MGKAFKIAIILTIIVSFLSTPLVFAAEGIEASTKPVVTSVVPGNVYIPRGTMIKAELIQGVNSKTSNVGDKAIFKITENVVINGVTVIQQGIVGEAVVKSVKRAGSWGKGGGIELEASNTKTINNIPVPLSLDTKKYGGGHGMVVPWLLVGVFSGFLKGKNQDIPAGTKFSVAVDADVDLGVPSELLANTMKNTMIVTTENN
ncbi:hypothetical protein [Sporomusa sp.]|uniref:hypothetical protein n=1 Tax=Sporomusa sp. TaxID=2078658 RepID=UPI002CF4E01B|nr:hypothetical protein [Sporomusa sp.]HWR08364.1 hypothetical protein [Sporomusa sp.]